MKNKKSILVVSALVRIIIAVVVLFLVVIPACTKIRSLFVGGVGSGPYEELLKSVDEMSRADDGEAVTQLFELDSGTAILVFESNTDRVIVDHQGPEDWFTLFYKPNPECEGNFACICKCTEFDINYEITGFIHKITYRHAICRAGMESCKTFKTYEVDGMCEIKEIGSGENVVVATSGDDPWKCTQGAYIGREVETSNGNGVVDTKSPERRIIRIENVGGIVYVCENPDPSDGCVPPLPAP
jgi:hypothetical protein